MELIGKIVWAIEERASDVHITSGRNIRYRVDGELRALDYCSTRENILELLEYLGITAKDNYFTAVDCSREVEGIRLRLNIYNTMSGLEISIRILANSIPSMSNLKLSEPLKAVSNIRKGLVIITGVTGSGKTTTAASLLNAINYSRKEHIITVEDPIEYLFKEDKCKISQREVGTHVASFSDASRDAMREDPDIIFLGEMRDATTIQNGLTLAETGHLVYGTAHARSVSEVLDRVVDMFNPLQQQQARSQFCNVLSAVIQQNLVKRACGGRYCLSEVLTVDQPIRNLLKTGKDLNSIRNLMIDSNTCELLSDSAIRGIREFNVDIETIRQYFTLDEFDQIVNRIG